MKQQVQIEITDLETRVAILQERRLSDLYIERSSAQMLVGNIYKGKVVRVLPGMQAAFVDIGEQRTGFLHARDIITATTASDTLISSETPSIIGLVHEGQSIVVQVTKDPVFEKGARLSTDISIAGRNLVYLPRAKKVAISKKIDDVLEVRRLTELVERWVLDSQAAPSPKAMMGHYIVRTQAEGVCEKQLLNDFSYLEKTWQRLQEKIQQVKVGEPVHIELPLLLRSIRDHASADIESILINCPIAFSQAQEFAQRFLPDIVNSMVLYQGEAPLFSINELESQIESALIPMVPLPSGGNLMLEQTEAMVTIDVNSGSNTGSYSANKKIRKKDLDLAYVTNVEASVEIARQIRLRNLAGMIVIDFIDMANQVQQRKVLKSLQVASSKDSVRVEISGMSRLGLVELTRKRTSQSWQQIICEPCQTCAGQGRVKGAETVCYEIFRELSSSADKITPTGFTVIAAPAVVALLNESKSGYLDKLKSSLSCSIKLVSEPCYLPSQFDVAFH